jgi:transcription antitermination factor NusG
MKGQENWYVIYTKSRQEKSLSEKLSAAGFEVYLPLVRKQSQWSDRKKVIEVPLFSSYVFIKDICEKDKLRDFKGFVGFLKYNNQPALVSSREIETLKSVILYGFDVSEAGDISRLEQGAKVMVMTGPLKGMTGELINIADHDLFMINFENFGNSIQVRVPSNILKKL